MKMAMWWREPDMGVPAGEVAGCAAGRLWRSACGALCAPGAAEAWAQLVRASPPGHIWHSLRNCIAYQARAWQSLVAAGAAEVVQPAAFQLAVVLRHTPADLAVKLLADLLHQHPQSQDLTSYVLALLTDDEASASFYNPPRANELESESPSPPPGPAPLRDLQLFSDCELAVLAASKEEYDAHAKLVRAEYSNMSHANYVQLRLKVLNQFSKIPKLYHTPEFEALEATARENIDREITTLRERSISGAHGPEEC